MSDLSAGDVGGGKNLEEWIKAADGNRISTKNTWNVPLINHFRNLDTFKENDRINFVKASVVLGGCMKVYSTRVDDVVENTEKLLESMHSEGDSRSRKKQARRQPAGSKNKEHVNIRLLGAGCYHNPIFRSVVSSDSGVFLFDKLNNHFYLYDTCGDRALVFSEQKLDMESVNMPLCPQLNMHSGCVAGQADGCGGRLGCARDNAGLCGGSPDLPPADASCGGDLPLSDVATGPPEAAPNTNAGGGLALSTVRSNGRGKRHRAKSRIDFTRAISRKALYGGEPAAISKKSAIRKKNKRSILLDDVFRDNALYRMNVDGSEAFGVDGHSVPGRDIGCDDLNSASSSDAVIGSQALDRNSNGTSHAEDNNRSFATARAPPRIDMAELKLFLHRYIDGTVDFATMKNELAEKHPDTPLSQVTEPIYLMGLLHLATERNLKLTGCPDRSVKIEQLV